MLTQPEIAASAAGLHFTTPRLHLRRLTPCDEQAQVEHDLNRTIMARIADPITPDQARQRAHAMLSEWQAAEDSWLGLAIIENSTDAFTGLSFFRVACYDNQSVEIGYRLHPDYWGRGYATEAANCLIDDYLNDTLHVRKLIAYCVADNAPSIRVLEKLGFDREGCLRQHSRLDNRWQDELVFGRLLR